MSAYYNEFDPKAAAWLRELIKQGHIADGVVDERSIEDVTPNELAGFTQCHFFAGIGVWSYALRSAGWADDRPIWTGSCPCQPFSAAGKGAGFADERHLWPAFHHLISQCQPDIVLGEQVASKDGLSWLDLVCADLEAEGYAAASVDLCAAGFGAPHIRQRLWWIGSRLGNAPSARLEGAARAGIQGTVERPSDAGDHGGMADPNSDGRGKGEWHDPAARHGHPAASTGNNGGMADTAGAGSLPSPHGGIHRGEESAGPRDAEPERPYSTGGMADTDSVGAERRSGDNAETTRLQENQRKPIHSSDVSQRDGENHSGRGIVRSDGLPSDAARPSPTNGFWRDADWLFCRDGKWRPVEPGTFPLAHGSAERVGRLRGYGNAINAEAAQGFIESVMETMK